MAPQATAEHDTAPEAESNETALNRVWSAEVVDEPSYEPEPDMAEATAEM